MPSLRRALPGTLRGHRERPGPSNAERCGAGQGDTGTSLWRVGDAPLMASRSPPPQEPVLLLTVSSCGFCGRREAAGQVRAPPGLCALMEHPECTQDSWRSRDSGFVFSRTRIWAILLPFSALAYDIFLGQHRHRCKGRVFPAQGFPYSSVLFQHHRLSFTTQSL